MIPFLLGQLKSRFQEKKGDLLAKKISMIPTRSVVTFAIERNELPRAEVAESTDRIILS